MGADRVRAVIDPAVVVDEKTRWELDARAAGESESPLPTAVSPTANGICSSGSTGVPKVILNLAPSLWIPQQGRTVLVELDAGGPAADHHGARADVSHQRLRHLPLPAGAATIWWCSKSSTRHWFWT